MTTTKPVRQQLIRLDRNAFNDMATFCEVQQVHHRAVVEQCIDAFISLPFSEQKAVYATVARPAHGDAERLRFYLDEDLTNQLRAQADRLGEKSLSSFFANIIQENLPVIAARYTNQPASAPEKTPFQLNDPTEEKTVINRELQKEMVDAIHDIADRVRLSRAEVCATVYGFQCARLERGETKSYTGAEKKALHLNSRGLARANGATLPVRITLPKALFEDMTSVVNRKLKVKNLRQATPIFFDDFLTTPAKEMNLPPFWRDALEQSPLVAAYRESVALGPAQTRKESEDINKNKKPTAAALNALDAFLEEMDAKRAEDGNAHTKKRQSFTPTPSASLSKDGYNEALARSRGFAPKESYDPLPAIAPPAANLPPKEDVGITETEQTPLEAANSPEARIAAMLKEVESLLNELHVDGEPFIAVESVEHFIEEYDLKLVPIISYHPTVGYK